MTRRDDNDPKVIADRERARAWAADHPEEAKARVKKWRADHPERARQSKLDWAARNPDKVRAISRASTLRQYNLTSVEWEARFDAQGRRCACCRSTETSKKGWHTDHDHETGAVRGILCSWCNMGIGQFDDNPVLLEQASLYLQPDAERVDEHY